MSKTEGQGSGDSARRRRSWSLEEKRRIVAESCEAGASVSKVARHHDLNTNMLFTWRRQLGTPVPRDEAVSFVPAMITAEPVPEKTAVASGPAGRMEIVFPSGARLIFGSDVDAGALGRVIKILVPR
jgi:transposase